MEENNADDLLWRINELYEMYSGEASFWGKIANKITDEFGEEYSKDRVRGLWRRSPHNNQSVQERETAVTPDLTIDSDGISSVDELLRKSNVDLETYSVDHFILNVWDGKEQVKVWLKRKTPDEFKQDEFLSVIEDVVSKYAKEPTIDRQNSLVAAYDNDDDGYLYVPAIFDAHIDSPHFVGNYEKHLQKMITNGLSAGYKASRIVFIIGNDFGHIDNDKYTTTAGTLVGAKQHYLDSIEERCEIVLRSTDMLRSYTRNLDIIAIPGNHDRISTSWLAKVVKSYHRNDLGVTVMDSPYPRKYYKYGDVFLAMSHGDEEKNSNMIGLMSIESPLEWATAKWREWLTGHLHKYGETYVMVNENFGVIKRIMPSLVHPDYWHIYSGFVGNHRAGVTMMYSKKGWAHTSYMPIE